MKKLRDADGSNDAELRPGIDSAIKYLLGKKEQDQYLAGAPSFDYCGFLAKLDSAKSALDVAAKHLQRLETDLVLGRLDAYQLSAHRIHSAYEGTMNALAEIQITTSETKLLHAPTTRALSLQKSAVHLAYSLVGDRVRGQARAVATEIMDGAKLNDPHPDASTLTKWLKEIRTERANVK